MSTEQGIKMQVQSVMKKERLRGSRQAERIFRILQDFIYDRGCPDGAQTEHTCNLTVEIYDWSLIKHKLGPVYVRFLPAISFRFRGNMKSNLVTLKSLSLIAFTAIKCKHVI